MRVIKVQFMAQLIKVNDKENQFVNSIKSRWSKLPSSEGWKYLGCLIEWGHSWLYYLSSTHFQRKRRKGNFHMLRKSAFHYKKLKRVRKQPLALLGWNRRKKEKGFSCPRVERTDESERSACVFVLVLHGRITRRWLKTLSRWIFAFSWAMIIVGIGRECVESFLFVPRGWEKEKLKKLFS